MSRYLNIGTYCFAGSNIRLERYKGTAGAGEAVINNLQTVLNRFSGRAVDLVLTCEGEESIGQRLEAAESFARPGRFIDTYSCFARQNKCHIAGSLKLLENNKVYNALVVFDTRGEICGCYKKTFLTDQELQKGLSPGDGAQCIETAIGRLGAAICFDINYAELREQYRKLPIDLMLFSSMFHGSYLQDFWAYDISSMWVSSCKDNCSEVRDPLGRVIAATTCYESEIVQKINLDYFVCHLDHNYLKLLELKKKYPEVIELSIPDSLGSAIIYSHDRARNAADFAAEFQITSLSFYLQQSKNLNIEAK